MPTSILNAAFTIISRLVSMGAIRQTGTMRNPKSGGFFLMAAIMIGFVAGLLTGDAMRGAVIGTAIGILIAVAIWLLDRRKRR